MDFRQDLWYTPYVDILNKGKTETIADTPETGWTVSRLLSNVWKRVAYAITNRVGKTDTPHPDFRIVSNFSGDFRWYQNKEWGPAPEPPYKLGFYFNDPSVLNDCPWVCKFGINLNEKMPDYKYFAVAYGAPHLHQEGYGLEEMKKWVMQFDHPSLMKYDGTLIKMLKGSAPPTR